MAGIYKFGTPWETPYDQAIEDCVIRVQETDPDPVCERGVFWTPTHEANGEYMVKIVTRQDA